MKLAVPLRMIAIARMLLVTPVYFDAVLHDAPSENIMIRELT
jgi:hypothetical protein